MYKIDLVMHDGCYPTPQVRDFVAGVCQNWGLTKKIAYQIKTAVDESLTNIVRHAYGHHTGKIKLQIRYGKKTMKISIKDWGKPFDRRKTTGPSDLIRNKKDHGLGLLMIDRLMDKVTRTRKDNYNELILTKYVKRIK